MQTLKIFKEVHKLQHRLKLSTVLGYVILYCGSLVLLSKIFIAIL